MHEHPVPSTDRASMLLTCPANAPSHELPLPELGMTAAEERLSWRRPAALRGAAATASDYLDQLPDDQAGMLRMNATGDGIVVQVTRESDQVRTALQELIGDVAVVEVETVRFSRSELDHIAAQIGRIKGLTWYSIGPSCESRVEVTVPSDPDRARRLIETVVDPCSFAVTTGGQPMPAVGLATAHATSTSRSPDQE